MSTRRAFAELLEPLSFHAHGSRFVRAVDGGLRQVIHLHGRSNPRERLYTVNLGVWSPELADFFARIDTRANFAFPSRDPRAPDEVDCHWRQRLGFLIEDPADLWWSIDDARSPIELLVEYGLPALHRVSTREGMERSFLVGESERVRTAKELAFASVLMATRGWSAQLEQIVGDIRRRVRPTPVWKEFVDAYEQALRRWAAEHGTQSD